MKILEIIVSVLLPIAFGWFFKVIRLFGDGEAVTLRKFVVKVSVPFIIFRNLYTADVSLFSQILPAIFSFIVMSMLFTGASVLLAPAVTSSMPQRRAFSIGTQFGNYGYLGWGIMANFFPDGGLTRAVFFTMFFWPVFLILGFTLMYLEDRHSFSRSAFFRALAANAIVPIVAAVAGLLCNTSKVVFHPIVDDFMKTFASFTIPLILFTIGLNLNFKLPRESVKVMSLSVVLRLIGGMVIGILTVLATSLLFRLDKTTVKVVLLESVMPTATMVVYFADFSETDRGLLSGIMTLSTLLSLVTLPLWFSALNALPFLR